MQTFNRICIKDFQVCEDWTIERGEEYLTSAVGSSMKASGIAPAEGEVTVFGKYWARVPVNIFAGEKEFTKT